MRLSKISWFVSGEQINYLPKPICKTMTNQAILRQLSSIIILLCHPIRHKLYVYQEYSYCKKAMIFMWSSQLSLIILQLQGKSSNFYWLSVLLICSWYLGLQVYTWGSVGRCSVVWESVGWGGAGFGVRRGWVVWGGVVIKAHCYSM